MSGTPRVTILRRVLGDPMRTSEFLGGKLQNLVFDETDGLVGSIDGIPGVAKKSITFQAAVGKGAHGGTETIAPQDSGVTKIASTLPCHAGVGLT
jgi:hypothetical protein